MRLDLRTRRSVFRDIAAPIAAILASLVLCSALIVWSGASVWNAYAAMLRGAVGNTFALTETLTRATPLIFAGLSAACAFRARFWNIGEEGQLYLGALAATIVGRGLVTLPPPLMIPFLMICGALAAGLLLFGLALLKYRFGVDEVVTSLLSNFIIVLLVSMLIDGVLKDPLGMGWPQSEPIISEGRLPKIIPGFRLHLGFLIAIVVAILMWFYDRFTTYGYEARAVGYNRQAAAFSGIPIGRTILRVAFLSGGLAGLAGVGEVAGFRSALSLDLSPGFGYTGIVVAMLAQLHPLGVIASAIFVAGIFVGADSMSRSVHVPSYIADVIGSTSLLLMLVSLLFARYRLRRG
jgi:general nucleoside transport system permease protein